MRCADRIFENCDIPRMKTISKVVESVFGYVCRVGLESKDYFHWRLFLFHEK